MKFRTYMGAQPGLSQVMQAVAAPGGSTYNDAMRDFAYVDSAKASARANTAQAVLDEGTAGSRSRIPDALRGVPLPPGMDAQGASDLFLSNTNPSMTDLSGFITEMGYNPVQQEAIEKAKQGDVHGSNALLNVLRPTPYQPYSQNESGIWNQASGDGAWSPGHMAGVAYDQAGVRERDAHGRAYDAAAGAYDALARSRQYIDVPPGHAVGTMNDVPASSVPGIIGALPDGRPIKQIPGGNIQTHLMATVNDPRLNNGAATNIPTIWGGKELTIPEAIEMAVAAGGKDPYSGKPFRGYASPDEAITDYMLRDHPKIDREGSWQQQRHRERLAGQTVSQFNPAYTAPMAPQQQGGGGRDPNALNAQLDEFFLEPATDSRGKPVTNPLTGTQSMIPNMGRRTAFVRWWKNQSNIENINEALIEYIANVEGKGNQNLLDEARAAIARGASRDAVVQRLRSMGVDPSGL